MIFIQMAKLKEAEEVIGYHFNNPTLLEEALQAAGAAASNPHTKGDREGNKRLALLGDALLSMMLLDHWYDSGKDTGKPNHTCLGIRSHY
jgi:ribonuclease-3